MAGGIGHDHSAARSRHFNTPGAAGSVDNRGARGVNNRGTARRTEARTGTVGAVELGAGTRPIRISRSARLVPDIRSAGLVPHRRLARLVRGRVAGLVSKRSARLVRGRVAGLVSKRSAGRVHASRSARLVRIRLSAGRVHASRSARLVRIRRSAGRVHASRSARLVRIRRSARLVHASRSARLVRRCTSAGVSGRRSWGWTARRRSRMSRRCWRWGALSWRRRAWLRGPVLVFLRVGDAG
jgi:hypothetical protein